MPEYETRVHAVGVRGCQCCPFGKHDDEECTHPDGIGDEWRSGEAMPDECPLHDVSVLVCKSIGRRGRAQVTEGGRIKLLAAGG